MEFCVTFLLNLAGLRPRQRGLETTYPLHVIGRCLGTPKRRIIPFGQSFHFFQTFLNFYFDRVMEASELECCLTVENLNSNGVVTKRRTYKSITVVLGGDEFRDIALRIVSSQSL